MENKENNILIPDAINCSIQKDFTQIPNAFIRNPDISMKAKIILCILLGNKKGWHSYITGIKRMLKEGTSTIKTGVKELEKNHYLLRIRFREKNTKIWRGSFWAYTDIQNTFDIQETVKYLNSKNLECIVNKEVYPQVKNLQVDKPTVDNLLVDNQPLTILNNNKSNINKTITSAEIDKTKKITPTDFDIFWKLYPRKTDKGKALTKWNTICNKNNKDKPTLKEIKIAIHYQKKSERWQDKQFIPNPTTWLNQSRWMDDAKEMNNFLYNNNKSNKSPKNGSRYFDKPGKVYTDYDGTSETIDLNK